MSENDQHFNNAYKDKTKIFKNVNQSATNYVQNAIENVAESTQDATQSLVNDVMKRRRDKNNN
ncbi:MAG: hypothetical protein ACQEWV_09625 [Bacillota bacterium]